MRYIGIRHRVKQTKEGEARPTLIAVCEGGNTAVYKLETETDELDFLLNRFPVSYRQVDPDDDLSQFQAHHIKWRTVRNGEDTSFLPHMFLRTHNKKEEVADKVPAAYDGFSAGDVVAMVLGGSGDRFAFALSRRGDDIGARVLRLPPAALKEERGDNLKNDDHILLASLVEGRSELFYKLTPQDRQVILVREKFRDRMEAQKARIGCEQRLFQRAIGRVFLSEEGLYPEGAIEDAFDAIKANDAVLQGMFMEEKKRNEELEKTVTQLSIWHGFFSGIEGCGPRIAAALIAGIGDIRRFSTKHKLKAYCGVHVRSGGKYADTPKEREFPRRTSGVQANWKGETRQALYLLGDQFNRRPKSTWGGKLLDYKAGFREKYPEPLEVGRNGKQTLVYTKRHIHQMGVWRTLTRFTERMWVEWTRLETSRE